MITILVKAADGTMIASAQSADDARLCIDRAYEDGDTVEILADEKHLCVQMDVTLLPGEVYLPNGRMTWRIPAGEHRLAYAPGAFEAKRHVITARPMTTEEINGRRDIACNPADLRGETDFFPISPRTSKRATRRASARATPSTGCIATIITASGRSAAGASARGKTRGAVSTSGAR